MTLLGHKHQVWALAFSPDGSLMASGDRGGQVNLWHLADGTLQRSIAADDGPIWSLAFTPDGRTLVTASDRRVQSWDAGTGTLRHALPSPGGSITRATLSPDGLLVATASTHREAAFEAARFIMDFLKTEAPFWKKEHSSAAKADGWVAATTADEGATRRWRR